MVTPDVTRREEEVEPLEGDLSSEGGGIGYEQGKKEGGMREGPSEEMGVGERRWARDDVFYSCGSHLWIEGYMDLWAYLDSSGL